MTSTELKAIRESLSLSKSDFAQAIGIAPVMEGKYEKGSREIPEEVAGKIYALKSTYEKKEAAEEEASPVAAEARVESVEADEKSSDTHTPAIPSFWFIAPLLMTHYLFTTSFLRSRMMRCHKRGFFTPWL